MSRSPSDFTSRRDVIKLGAFAAGGLALGRMPRLAIEQALEQQELPLITKVIPSSGERIPVVGIGTNAYGVATAEERAPLRETVKRLTELGGKVIDTANNYGRGQSEATLGEIFTELGNRDRIFLVSKFTAPQDNLEAGRAQATDTFTRLRTEKLDALLVHNLGGVDVLMPQLLEWKQAGRIRHLGISTSSDGQYAPLMELMKKYPLDIIQIDYSVGNRSAADAVLPLAQERGIGVMINVPFGGRNAAGRTFSGLASVPLPAWAAEFDAKTWPQVLLKYVVSHPAVTVAIPGTRSVAHVEDNHGGARGRLPDAAMRKRIEEFWDNNRG
jgi:aryl-alcohol dehydrogenase-like predicted oxidoreductase